MGYCTDVIPFEISEDSLSYADRDNKFWMLVYPVSNYFELYEPEILDKIKETIKVPHVFLIECNRFDLIRKLVNAFPLDVNLFIQNPNGVLFDRNQFDQFKGFEDFWNEESEP